MKIEYPYGATPLDADERVGLIPKHITTQSELNEWEQVNILEAELWLDRFYYEERKGKNYISIHKLLDVAFMQEVHRKMFNKTWKWAGTFRKTDKNIGVDWLIIRIRLKDLLEDIRY